MERIIIVDYGMGNIRSVARALKKVAKKSEVIISGDASDLSKADRVVFPGQGAMRDCMRELQTRELISPLLDAFKTKPFLGVCIGLQILFEFSEENSTECLGVLGGRVEKFSMEKTGGDRIKVPHIGWNNVKRVRRHPLWEGIPDSSRFYFVHSYFPRVNDKDIIFGVCDYDETFCCAVGLKNVFAVQFHPEKSQTVGLQFLANFINWDGRV